ncbi:MAG: tetratricopeptide repeat protein [Syntrophales bacterium]
MRWTVILLSGILLAVSGRASAAAGQSAPVTNSAEERLGADTPLLSTTGLQTIVPEDARISESEALLALARILAEDETTFAEAGRLYRELIKRKPDDPEILAGMADLALAEGHADECFALSGRIPEKGRTEAGRLASAVRMTAFGDFTGAERIYREHLEKRPADRPVRLRLADLLVAMQRPEEAEGIYRALLLDEPGARDLLLAMGRLKEGEKAYGEAERWARKALERTPGQGDASLLLGDILSAMHRGEEAREAYARGGAGGHGKDAALGIGLSYLREGNAVLARQAFGRALAIAPDDVEARYRFAGPEKVGSDGFVAEVLTEQSSRRLIRWADLYAADGYRRQAVRICEAVLARDPEYFPAEVARAEFLAFDGQYERSAAAYEHLARRFPGFSRILLGRARLMAWSKRYSRSLALYDELHRLNPRDPVPLREKARTAFWAKRPATGEESYRQLLSPPVDPSFLAAVLPVTGEIRDDRLQDAVRKLRERVEKGDAGEGYSGFRGDFEPLAETLPPRDRRRIEAVLIDYLPAWRVQKAVGLEWKAKELVRNRRTTRAIPLYRSLIAAEPANEEARFDLAQAFCAVGLDDCAGKAYRGLLEMDPFHTEAGRALERREIHDRPAVSLEGSSWREEGRGDLARIERFRTDATLEVPLSGRYHLRFKVSDWIERPDHNGQSYQAVGPGVAVDGVFSSSVRGEAGWMVKEYSDRDLVARHTGYGRLWFNLRDVATLGIGAERADEIANLFALKQGVQSDTLWVSARSDLTDRLEVGGTARWLEYNDRNGAQYHSLAVGYALTDHPRILKVILSGEYRNTRETNGYLYQAGVLTDIIHPYWAPEHNKAGAVTLEWRHDLAKEFFCGAALHYYDLKLSLGTDSESNRSVRVEGEWRYEIRKHWLVGLKGMIHRSREWDAESLLAEVSYRF